MLNGQNGMKKPEEGSYMLARSMNNALLWNGENDQRGQMEDKGWIGAGGQFLQQTMFVAEDKSPE